MGARAKVGLLVVVITAVVIFAAFVLRTRDVDSASDRAHGSVASPVAGASEASTPQLAEPGANGARDPARTELDAPLVAATDELATATLRFTVLARTTRAPVADVLLFLGAVDTGRGDTGGGDTGRGDTGGGDTPADASGTETPHPVGSARDGRHWTDTDGLVEFGDVPSGLMLQASVVQRTAPYAMTKVTIEPLTPGERRELVIERPDRPDREFWLRLVDAQSGKPIAGARVFQSDRPGFHGVDSGWMFDVDETKVVTTDAEGHAVVQSPSWRNESLHVDAAGFSPVATPIVAGHETRDRALVLQLERAGVAGARRSRRRARGADGKPRERRGHQSRARRVTARRG
ncbi:MAG: hypothetical protein L6Q99_10550 [Planctomycetes bacterium]|nr:hypothetical protein [Planctomycetota bacterium]